jgi:hypothetical protein
MNIRSGDIRQFTIQGREFDPAPNTSVNVMLSGMTNENQSTGNGQLHTTQRRKLGGFDGMTLSIDASRQDYEFLQGISNAGVPVPVTMTLPGNQTYAGDLNVEGEIGHNAGDGTLELTMRGKTFEQI